MPRGVRSQEEAEQLEEFSTKPKGSEAQDDDEDPLNRLDQEIPDEPPKPVDDEDEDKGLTPEQKKAKNDQTRFEYWQSKATTLAKQMEQMSQFAQLGQIVAQDPALMEAALKPEARRRLSGDTTQESAPQKVKAPTPPTKPANYDEVEALNDVNSESYKFRVQNEQFTRDMLAYMVQKEAEREQATILAQEQEQKLQEQRQKLEDLRQTLIVEYAFKPEQAADFLATMGGKEAYSIPNLVRLYWMLRKPKTNSHTPSPKELLERQRRQGAAPPIVEGGEEHESTDDEKSFNAGLLNHKRKALY